MARVRSNKRCVWSVDAFSRLAAHLEVHPGCVGSVECVDCGRIEGVPGCGAPGSALQAPGCSAP
eukprot:50793-Chlamydomonas_euryale.AAC.1